MAPPKLHVSGGCSAHMAPDAMHDSPRQHPLLAQVLAPQQTCMAPPQATKLPFEHTSIRLPGLAAALATQLPPPQHPPAWQAPIAQQV